MTEQQRDYQRAYRRDNHAAIIRYQREYRARKKAEKTAERYTRNYDYTAPNGVSE